MAGVPATITLNNANNTDNQLAAVMMSANTNLSHTPPNTWYCWSINGSNAASMSNLALGYDGADAITGYMWDFGAGNFEAGHRRWILYPQTQIMGTGDVPPAGGYSPANATWVFDANLFGPRPATRQPYVAWPPAGYVPRQLVYPRWSFALTNADFTNATITMKSNGVVVATSTQQYVTGYGENTLVWYPSSLDPNNFNTVFPFGGTDTVYSITVTNIKFGAGMVGYTYNVTVFDPAVPGADYFPPTINGTNQPFVGVANPYTFTPVTNVTGYQWRSTLRSNFYFLDGAENALTNFTVNTSAGYAVRDSALHASGSYSFHLTHTNPVDQTLALNQTFTPQSNTVVLFKSELGYSGNGEVAKVQISTDNAASWSDVYSQAGTNGPGMSGPGETSFNSRSAGLSNFVGQTALLRFNYSFVGGSYFPQTNSNVGWHIDDITVTNAEIWTVLGTNSIATTNFTFTPTLTNSYNLEARGLIFTEFPLDWGPAKQVTAVIGPTTITMGTPVIAGIQVQLNFTVTGLASTFKLLQANQLGAAWSTNAGATFTTNVPGSSYRFTTTNGPATRFYRVQTP